MTDNTDTRMKRLGYRTPADVPEPDQLVLAEYVSGGRVVIITLNRPHADNAITTELAAQLIEVLETIAARPTVRCAILTGAGDRAFSVGGDLYQRKQMTKEEWLRQRQVFDRVLYNLRRLRRPIFTAVNGMAYGGGCEMAISTDFIIASDEARLRPARSDRWLERGRRLTGLPSAFSPPGDGDADADDRRTDHCPGGLPAWHGQFSPSQGRTHERSPQHCRKDRR